MHAYIYVLPFTHTLVLWTMHSGITNVLIAIGACCHDIPRIITCYRSAHSVVCVVTIPRTYMATLYRVAVPVVMSPALIPISGQHEIPGLPPPTGAALLPVAHGLPPWNPGDPTPFIRCRCVRGRAARR